jgi:5-methyltetrahydrofolate corrinoid/iron sulfur protein methyltransferase
MFVIGELINGMYPNIARAISSRNKEMVRKYALDQVTCGVDALDVNCGPASRDPLIDMPWLIETVQEITAKPLCIDSSNPQVIKEGLKVSRNKVIINSTTADKDKLDILIPLAKQYKAKLIGITISQKGIPQNKDQRLELAATIIAYCQDKEFPIEDLYLDPILLPVNVAQEQMIDILKSIQEFKILSEPSPNTLVGLSNVSQGASRINRRLINRTFLALAIAYGLNSAILNPKDAILMETLVTAELILNKNIYCDSYLEAYRKK